MSPTELPRNTQNRNEKRLVKLMFIVALCGVLASLILPFIM
jgi:hypothetical protein